MNLLKTRLSGKDCTICTPTPWKMTPPLSPKTVDQYQGFYVLQGRGREMGIAHEKNIKQWALFSIQQ